MPMESVLIIGEEDSPILMLYNADFESVEMNHSVDITGSELPIDTLTINMYASKQGVYRMLNFNRGLMTVDGKYLLAAGGMRLLTSDGFPDDRVITGYVSLSASGGYFLYDVNGEKLMTPITEDVADVWMRMFSGISYGTPVLYRAIQNYEKIDEETGEITGTETITDEFQFYWSTFERVGRYAFTLTAISAIGLLDNLESNGMMCENVSMSDVLRSILELTYSGTERDEERNQDVYRYTSGNAIYFIDENVAGLRIYGWLPAESKRENLHRLLISTGTIAMRRGKGTWFTVLPITAIELEKEQTFIGGTVTYNRGISKISLQEYSYMQYADTAPVVLYDNTDGSNLTGLTKIVFQNAPVFGLKASGALTIHSSNCNYATVSGVGQLTGFPYSVITNAITKGDDSASQNQTATIDSVATINYLNSQNVIGRLFAIYNSLEEAGVDITRRRVDAGSLIDFYDAYGKRVKGYIISANTKSTTFMRSTCQIYVFENPEKIVDYFGNQWGYSYILSGNGLFTIPDNLDGQSLRAVLISGGAGGSSGFHGNKSDDNSEAEAASGGDGGNGGSLFSYDFTGVAGKVYAFSCGEGGTAGISTDETDSEGKYISNLGEQGATTFLGNAADGIVATLDVPNNSNGYKDIITSKVYASRGDKGVSGGLATTADENLQELLSRNNGESQGDVHNNEVRNYVYSPWDGRRWISGDIGTSMKYYNDKVRNSMRFGFGGMGGGAAIGNPGNSEERQEILGGNGTASNNYGHGGTGGTGATAKPIFGRELHYGDGGSGGHGGGSGGRGGSYKDDPEWDDTGVAESGEGGFGSDGEQGADGCIIVYTKSAIPDFENYVQKKSNVGIAYGNPAVFENAAHNKRLKGLTVYVSPAQEGEGNPYPPGGGKNLFNNTLANAWEYGYFETVTENNDTTAKWKYSERYLTSYTVELMANSAYTASLNSSSEDVKTLYITAINFFDGSKKWISSASVSAKSRIASFAVPSGASFARVTLSEDGSTTIMIEDANSQLLQIESGRTKTAYAAFSNVRPIVNHSSISIIRNKPFQAFSVSVNAPFYGGEVNMITGELLSQYDTLDITNDIQFQAVEDDGRIYFVADIGEAFLSNDDLEDQYYSHGVCENPQSSNVSCACLVKKDDSVQLMLGFPAQMGITTTDKLTDWISESKSSITITYKTNDTITNVENLDIRMAEGINSFSSDNGFVSVEYPLSFQELIIDTYPVKTVSGNPLNFDDGADNVPIKKMTVDMSPIQSGTGTPSLENVRPIVGWDSVTITHTGRNLRDWSITDSNFPVNYHGYANGRWDGVWDATAFIGKTLTYSAYLDSNGVSGTLRVRVWFLKNGSSTSTIANGNTIPSAGSGRSTVTFTVPDCDQMALGLQMLAGTRAYNPQVEFGDAVSEYEPYTGETLRVTLPSDAGTVYGGTLGVTNGNLSVTHGEIAFDGTETWYRQAAGTGGAISFVYAIGPDGSVVNNSGICSHYPSAIIASGNSIVGCRVYNSAALGEARIVIRPDVSVIDTVDNWKTFLKEQAAAGTPVQVAWALAEPETFAVSPTSITTLKGYNYISADTGYVSVSYRADPETVYKALKEAM